MSEAVSTSAKRVCDEKLQDDRSAAESVLCGHSLQELRCIMAHVDSCWHLFAAGTSRAWRAAYNSGDKTRRTSARAALASASTTQWAIEAGSHDIHRFEKQTCRWKYLKRHQSCPYSSRVCRALDPQQTLALSKQNGCQHRLTLMECMDLAVAYGAASSLRWLLDHKAELVQSSDRPPNPRMHFDSDEGYLETDISHLLFHLRSASVKRGEIEMLQILDEAGLLEANSEDRSVTMISKACRNNQLHVIEWLLARGHWLPVEYDTEYDDSQLL